MIPWEVFERHADDLDARERIAKLWRRKYLCCIKPGFENLEILMEAIAAQSRPNNGKCAQCGAPLQWRTDVGWACGHCDTLAENE